MKRFIFKNRENQISNIVEYNIKASNKFIYKYITNGPSVDESTECKQSSGSNQFYPAALCICYKRIVNNHIETIAKVLKCPYCYGSHIHTVNTEDMKFSKNIKCGDMIDILRNNVIKTADCCHFYNINHDLRNTPREKEESLTLRYSVIVIDESYSQTSPPSQTSTSKCILYPLNNINSIISKRKCIGYNKNGSKCHRLGDPTCDKHKKITYYTIYTNAKKYGMIKE